MVQEQVPELVPERVYWGGGRTRSWRWQIEVVVLREEHLFLGALGFDMSTPTGAESVEALFRRPDVVMRATCTLLLRFAADTALNSHFKKKVSLEEQKAQKEDRFLRKTDRLHDSRLLSSYRSS